MAERKIRVLLGKLGEGHKEASLDLAKRLGDAGFIKQKGNYMFSDR